MNQLKDLLIDGLIRTADNRFFMPDQTLKSLMTESNIKRTLLERGINPEDIPSALAEAMGPGMKCFAILVRIGFPRLFIQFIENGVLDQYLPIENTGHGVFADFIANEVPSEFFIVQYEYLAPLFTKNQIQRRLPDQIILPFIKDSRIDSGGFGTIHKVSLSSKHQRLVPNPSEDSVDVIRKELKSNDHTETVTLRNFRDELRIMKHLYHLRNPNIIQFLAAYSHRGSHSFLLLPVAEGNLSTLFKSDEAAGKTFNSASELLDAMHGLVKAVTALHNYHWVLDLDGVPSQGPESTSGIGVQLSGCHHDLKPENILVHGKKLILADFGISRLKSSEPGQNTKTSVKRGNDDYVAPECYQVIINRQKVGRKSDIWSLGCIFLELLIFFVMDTAAVENFWHDRRLQQGKWILAEFHANGELKPAVQKWIDTLRSEMKEVSLQGMLLLIDEMLKINPEIRPTATDVEGTLSCLRLKALFDKVLKSLQVVTTLLKEPSLAIQYERLRAWGESVGLYYDSGRGNWGVNYRAEDVIFSDEMYQTLLILSTHIEELENKSKEFPIDNDPNQKTEGSDLPSCEITTDAEFPEDEETKQPVEDFVLPIAEGNERLAGLIPESRREIMKRSWYRRIVQPQELDTLHDIQLSAVKSEASVELSAMAEMRARLEAARSGKQDYGDPVDMELDPSGFMEAEWELLGRHSIIECSIARKNPDPLAPPTGVSNLSGVSIDKDSNSRFLVEWKSYAGVKDSGTIALLRKQIQLLATLPNSQFKPLHFRVLKCAGFFEAEDRKAFGMVYEFPGQSDTAATPITLHSHISSTGERRLPLEHLFQLAQGLVSCVLDFHSVGWLHKSLTSENIVFFPVSQPPNAILIREPYIIGFDHSRPTDSLFTLGPVEDLDADYQDPRYTQETGFCKAFEYYSVGIILLEVGLWRTFSSIVKRKEYRGYNQNAIRKAILQKYIPSLKSSMGTTYYKAVRACISGELGNRTTPDTEVENAFQKLVVERLLSCKLGSEV
ncbi:kinase-like domain-containing protein [Tirmania nivea]|nr:kinase-like domain-containing protein [Tirmania nivea]